MVKKQQMQWSQQGAHYLLQTRTAVLNDDLKTQFGHWYPGIKLGDEAEHSWAEKMAASMPNGFLWSPDSPQDHAKDIISLVDKCK